MCIKHYRRLGARARPMGHFACFRPWVTLRLRSRQSACDAAGSPVNFIDPAERDASNRPARLITKVSFMGSLSGLPLLSSWCVQAHHTLMSLSDSGLWRPACMRPVLGFELQRGG